MSDVIDSPAAPPPVPHPVEPLASSDINWTWHAVRVRATGAVDPTSGLAAGTSFNGVTLAAGDVVFLPMQTSGATETDPTSGFTNSPQNGLYAVPASGAAARAAFADTAQDLARIGFYLREGTVGTGAQYTLSLDADQITLGTTPLPFSELAPPVDYGQVVEALEARVDALEPAVGNLLTDPFLKFLNVLAQFTTLGTWPPADGANPFGGGSVATTGGTARIYRALPPGVLAGDAFSVRARYAQSSAGQAQLIFINAAGSPISAGQATQPSTVVGDNDVHLSSVVPATAVGFRFDVFGAGTGKLYALAANVGRARPGLVEAPPNADFAEAPEQNLLEDPFLTRLGYLAIKPGTLGTWTPSDPANPFGGGSVAGSVLRLYRALPRGIRVGDTVSVRQMATATSVPTHSLYFVDAAGTTIAGTSASAFGAVGPHDRTLRAVVPTGAVGVRMDLTGGGASKVFALALDYGAVIPAFVEAPAAYDRNAVYSAVANRRLVLFGDSIMTTYDQTANAYIENILAPVLEAQVVNCAIGGTTMALRTDPNFSALSMAALAEAIVSNSWTAQDAAAVAIPAAATPLGRLKAISWPDVQTVVIAFGTNDYAAEQKPLGTITDTTGATFRGAINAVVDKLLTAWPHLQIVFQTPIYRDRFEGGPNAASGTGSISGMTLTVTAKTVGAFTAGQTLFARQGMNRRTNIVAQLTGTTGGVGTYQLDRSQTVAATTVYGMAYDPGDVRQNAQGLTLTAYVDAVIEMARRKALPVIDAYRESGLNGETVTRRSEDGVHPSPAVGMYDLARFMARGLAVTVR